MKNTIEYLFFFQAADGIRDPLVTGVQTCALPISPARQQRARWGEAVRRWARVPSNPGVPGKPAIGLIGVEARCWFAGAESEFTPKLPDLRPFSAQPALPWYREAHPKSAKAGFPANWVPRQTRGPRQTRSCVCWGG